MPNLTAEFFSRDAFEVAPALIGCYLFTTIMGKRTGGMIIETEAYDQNDPFAHCYFGSRHPAKTDSKPMFFAPGNVYIYYASQFPCLNFVCREEDFGSAQASLEKL